MACKEAFRAQRPAQLEVESGSGSLLGDRFARSAHLLDSGFPPQSCENVGWSQMVAGLFYFRYSSKKWLFFRGGQ